MYFVVAFATDYYGITDQLTAKTFVRQVVNMKLDARLSAYLRWAMLTAIATESLQLLLQNELAECLPAWCLQIFLVFMRL